MVFAVNTGFRLGDILNLTWEVVDLDAATINFKVKKNRRMLDFPLNDKALAVVRSWYGIRKCEYVFYNPETGGPWKNLWLGLKKACRKAGLKDVTWHTFRHTFASGLNGDGADLVTVKEAGQPFRHQDDDALRLYQPRSKAAGGCAAWCHFGESACQEDRLGVVTVFATIWEVR